MMSDQEFNEMKEWGERKMKEIDAELDKLIKGYKEMPKEALRERLSIIDTDTLKWISTELALPSEEYEICQIAKEVLNEKGESL
ncbi:MAG: hypothetical protein JWP69_503 [Flaviaesturariibacter sp.]|nr:hypothetical protein [Flaviaesturariibacter sp.]